MTTTTPGRVTEWYYADNGEVKGPVPEEIIIELVVKGKVSRDASVWHAGLTDWAPLTETELRSMFMFLPPPLHRENISYCLKTPNPRQGLKLESNGESLEMINQVVRVRDINMSGDEIFYYQALINYADEEMELEALSMEELGVQVDNFITELQQLREAIQQGEFIEISL